MEIQVFETIGILGTAAATIALVLLLWKAVKQMEVTVSLSRIQTDMRFRPWIGPSSSITHIIHNQDEKEQFEIMIKNFGEIPAKAVYVLFEQFSSLPKKSEINFKKIEKFNLGPVLPSMEKRYWIMIDSEKIQKCKEGKEKLFTVLIFEYEVSMGTSSYGMISEYIPEKNSFMHKEMWVETPEKT